MFPMPRMEGSYPSPASYGIAQRPFVDQLLSVEGALQGVSC